MMKRTNFLLTVACCILIISDFCVPPIHGRKCYVCGNCPDPANEVECESVETLCSVGEEKSGKIIRQCQTISNKERDEKAGIKCDEIHAEHGYKQCYCDTDLCNGNSLLKSGATTSDSGRAKGHYSVFIVVFVSAYVSGRYAY